MRSVMEKDLEDSVYQLLGYDNVAKKVKSSLITFLFLIDNYINELHESPAWNSSQVGFKFTYFVNLVTFRPFSNFL